MYTTLAERATVDRGNSQLVARTVRLLKTYLPQSAPSADVLARLGAFCKEIAATTTDAALQTVRVIAARHPAQTGPALTDAREIRDSVTATDDHLCAGAHCQADARGRQRGTCCAASPPVG